MTYGNHPVGTAGVHGLTDWDRTAATLMELDEAGDLSDFDGEVELANTVLGLPEGRLGEEGDEEMADFEFDGPLVF